MSADAPRDTYVVVFNANHGPGMRSGSFRMVKGLDAALDVMQAYIQGFSESKGRTLQWDYVQGIKGIVECGYQETYFGHSVCLVKSTGDGAWDLATFADGNW